MAICEISPYHGALCLIIPFCGLIPGSSDFFIAINPFPQKCSLGFGRAAFCCVINEIGTLSQWYLQTAVKSAQMDMIDKRDRMASP
jgi:hypothetical protein